MADMFSLSERARFRKHNFQTFARGQLLQFLPIFPIFSKQRADQTRQSASTIQDPSTIGPTQLASPFRTPLQREWSAQVRLATPVRYRDAGSCRHSGNPRRLRESESESTRLDLPRATRCPHRQLERSDGSARVSSRRERGTQRYYLRLRWSVKKRAVGCSRRPYSSDDTVCSPARRR